MGKKLLPHRLSTKILKDEKTKFIILIHFRFLALRTALTTETDFLFMPEFPPPDNWPDMLEEKVRLVSIVHSQYSIINIFYIIDAIFFFILFKGNELGKRLHLIIVSEGATDRHNNPITSQQIRDILANKLKLDARITVLGHVQRGGNASAYDRILVSCKNQ